MNAEKLDANEYLSFFKQELTENLLSFWMPRCLDRETADISTALPTMEAS